MPAGSSGLPLGLRLIGRSGDDVMLLRAGKDIQKKLAVGPFRRLAKLA